MERGILHTEHMCPSCSVSMHLQISRGIFRCGKRECRKSVSVRLRSFFAGHKLLCSQILHLAHLWLGKVPVRYSIEATGHSSTTVCSIHQYFRELVSDSVEIEDVIIGGQGIVIEIDETKLGKRKYNRGHPVEGVWVVGGVERTPERRVFLAKIEVRNRESLFEIIDRHVLPGSVIYTDLWRGYTGLEFINEYQHHTVNHSIQFIVPGTNIHTNNIEGTWNGLKTQIKPRNRNVRIEEHLWEFIWRRKNCRRLWDAFLEALNDIVYN
jgi:ISXO2-like transposase domain